MVLHTGVKNKGYLEAFLPFAGSMTDKLISALERRTGVRFDKLLNVENMNMEDGTDVEVLSRELLRAVNKLRASRG